MRDAVRDYAALHGELTRAGQEAVALVQGLLDEAGINYLSVSGRTKSIPSFAEKAARTKAGTPLYTDPLTQITDLLGRPGDHLRPRRRRRRGRRAGRAGASCTTTATGASRPRTRAGSATPAGT